MPALLKVVANIESPVDACSLRNEGNRFGDTRLTMLYLARISRPAGEDSKIAMSRAGTGENSDMWGVRRTMVTTYGVWMEFRGDVVKGVTLLVTGEDRGLSSEVEGLV